MVVDKTVKDYLVSVPAERRGMLDKLHKLILGLYP